MDIKRLAVFCKVVELRSFTQAAREVNLSQPTVSEHIRLLEQAFEEKLVDRLGREVLPTPIGQILYRYAREIIRVRDEAVQAIDEFKGKLSGTLVLGASTIPGAYLLPHPVENFKKLHSAIKIQLQISGTASIINKVLDGSVEIGIVGALPKDQRLRSEEIFADELTLAVYPAHPWAKREGINSQELHAEPFILREYGSGTRQVMTDALEKAGISVESLDQVAEMGSSEAVKQAIKAGMGISILSSLSIEEDIQYQTLIRVPVTDISMHRPFYLIQRHKRELSPPAAAFLSYLQKFS